MHDQARMRVYPRFSLATVAPQIVTATTTPPQVEPVEVMVVTAPGVVTTAHQAEPTVTATATETATTSPQADPKFRARNNDGGDNQYLQEALRIRIELLKLERNGVKFDQFHLVHAYQGYLKKRHGIYQTLYGVMCHAISMICGEDLEMEEKSLTEKLFVDPNS
jgi:hypothetical protein